MQFKADEWNQARDFHRLFSYDSGAIACELARQNVPFTAYSIVGSENPDTIQQRFSLLKNTEYIELTRERFLKARNHLKAYCEEYT